MGNMFIKKTCTENRYNLSTVAKEVKYWESLSQISLNTSECGEESRNLPETANDIIDDIINTDDLLVITNSDDDSIIFRGSGDQCNSWVAMNKHRFRKGTLHKVYILNNAKLAWKWIICY